ncbi:MAG: ligase-associated DNA damage response endonuclease PdeM [Pseudomonadota bacterium]
MNKTITFGGDEFVPDTRGALYWPAQNTLLVADLHFEKASHFAERGYLLPPYDTLETLRTLESVIQHYVPKRVIALGDSWHDMGGPSRMDPRDRAMLRSLCAQTDITWISGNHDPQPTGFGTHIPKLTSSAFAMVHEATRAATQPTFCGHYHPKVRVRLRKSSRSLPCFAVYDHVCVLPSFGAFTGGLDISHSTLTDALGMPHTVYACGRERVYHLPLEHMAQTGAPDAA